MFINIKQHSLTQQFDTIPNILSKYQLKKLYFRYCIQQDLTQLIYLQKLKVNLNVYKHQTIIHYNTTIRYDS
jgi:hypothetical protein